MRWIRARIKALRGLERQMPGFLWATGELIGTAIVMLLTGLVLGAVLF